MILIGDMGQRVVGAGKRRGCNILREGLAERFWFAFERGVCIYVLLHRAMPLDGVLVPVGNTIEIHESTESSFADKYLCLTAIFASGEKFDLQHYTFTAQQ